MNIYQKLFVRAAVLSLNAFLLYEKLNFYNERLLADLKNINKNSFTSIHNWYKIIESDRIINPHKDGE
jgi:hypothetical protein